MRVSWCADGPVVRGKAAWFLALAGEESMLGLFKEAAIDVRRDEIEGYVYVRLHGDQVGHTQ